MAKERFAALQDYEQLGSGYQIALKDLEIRGGGNVLGKEQHGNMEAIGLSLYTKMLKLISEQIREGKK
jgi:transcription-repair coupling factor (superfamily II helicase)